MERYSEFWGWLVGFLVVYLVGWIGCWRLRSYGRENQTVGYRPSQCLFIN